MVSYVFCDNCSLQGTGRGSGVELKDAKEDTEPISGPANTSSFTRVQSFDAVDEVEEGDDVISDKNYIMHQVPLPLIFNRVK